MRDLIRKYDASSASQAESGHMNSEARSYAQPVYQSNFGQMNGQGDVMQCQLTAEGQAYIDRVKTPGVWGGHPEAHAMAVASGLKTSIYRAEGDGDGAQLKHVHDIGKGDDEHAGLSLLWTGNHYQVLRGGADMHNQPLAGKIMHDPGKVGDCLYEAMFYLKRRGGGGDGSELSQKLRDEHSYRSTVSNAMRSTAAGYMPHGLANFLGHADVEEAASKSKKKSPLAAFDKDNGGIEAGMALSALSHDYSPAEHYIVGDKKGPVLHSRKTGEKVQSVNDYFRKLECLSRADKKVREALLDHLASDPSYMKEPPKEKDHGPLPGFDYDQTAEPKIQVPSGEKDFSGEAGGKTVAEAVDEAIKGLDLTGSASFAHSRHDFQPTGGTHQNLQIQLGGSKLSYRRGEGDTSSTLVLISHELFDKYKGHPKFADIVREAHRRSFKNRTRVEIKEKRTIRKALKAAKGNLVFMIYPLQSILGKRKNGLT